MSRVHANMQHSRRAVWRSGDRAPHSVGSRALVGIPPQVIGSGSVEASGSASRRSQFSNDDTVASATGGWTEHRDTQ